MAQINLGHVVGQGVPSGGTAGQILKKNGSTNFDTSWATLDGSMVLVSAGDSTTVQQSLAAVKSDMGIVEDGNTATHTIAAGQYVIWKGALYTASAAIPAGTTLSTSNLTAVSGGGLNALNGKIDGFLARTSIANFSANNDTWTATSNGFVNVIATENVTGTWYAYAYEGSTIRAGGIGGLNGTGGLTESFMFPVHKGVTYKLLVGGISSVTTQFYPM